MFDPTALRNPQQTEMLAMLQHFTRNIKYVIHTDDDQNRIEVTLSTDSKDCAQLIPQLRELFILMVIRTFYHMFAMKGERV